MSEGEASAETTATETVATEEKNWYDGHDYAAEDIGFIQNKGWETPNDMLSSYQSLEKLHGGGADKLLQIPDEGDTDGWSKLHGRLGRPDDVAGYGLELPTEGLTDAKLLETYSAKAHELGLSKANTTALYEMFNDYAKEVGETGANDLKIQQETDIAELRKEWGEKGYAESEELAKRAFRQFGVEGETSTELEAMLGSAGLIRLFAGIGKSIMGDVAVNPDAATTSTFGTTDEQVYANIASLKAELEADKDRLRAYNSGIGPDRKKMAEYDAFIEASQEPIRR